MAGFNTISLKLKEMYQVLNSLTLSQLLVSIIYDDSLPARQFGDPVDACFDLVSSLIALLKI